MIIVNKTTLKVVSENEFRQLHPNISFPAVLSSAALEGTDYEYVTPQAAPSTTKYQSLVLGAPYRYSGSIRVKYEVVDNTPSIEEILKEYESAIDAHIDSKAREYKYNNVYSMISYRGDPNPKFAQEAESMFAWRSAVWTKANQDLQEYLVSLQTETPLNLPTVEDVIADLPEFVLV